MSKYRIETMVAGVLFITATAATMASQMIIAPMVATPNVQEFVIEHRTLFVLGVLLEIVNALASAGIAVAFFPILWNCARVLAPAYLTLRAIEASIGVAATIGLVLLLTSDSGAFAIEFHDLAFGLLLMVFSVSTLILYPALFRFRLVPAVLSIWGLVGGLMLLVSGLLILLGQIDFGSTTDTILSLPIWINEMALALWLIFRGVDLTKTGSDAGCD
ncbi:MAG: DUF4386 domain-containing protein [Hyphomicrobiales bacterium]|nr:DUF4386 domain-containing protein [Hyphomicrobiales bacterium]